VWVPGNAKYGTIPGFCAMSNEVRRDDVEGYKIDATIYEVTDLENNIWTEVTQGDAQLICKSLGEGYHLISENEWMTVAENIIDNNYNDIDEVRDGLQIAATSSFGVSHILTNDFVIYNFSGGVGEWTDKLTTQAGILEPYTGDWQEYYTVEDYKALNISPPYYYTHNENGIGLYKTGLEEDKPIRAFVRGETGIFSLDLSYSPASSSPEIGFRCAR